MSNISVWIISVTVATLLSAMVDVIMPQGKMLKIIKSVMGIFILIVIITPVKNFDLSKLDLSKINGFSIDNKFIEERSSDIFNSLKKEIESNLDSNGYKQVYVQINGNFSGGNLEVYSVYVDLENSVISEDMANINKYTNIVAIIKKTIDVDDEKVIFYE